MDEGKLKTAVIGLNEGGRLLLKAAREIEHFAIAAVADKDTKLAEQIAAEYECAGYDDYRQLVVQNQLDCLLVAAGMHACEEQIRTAIKKRFNVLKLAPAARNFEEAAEIVKLAEQKDTKFIVANPYRFAPSYVALRESFEQGKIEQVFLVTAFCNVGDIDLPPWQTDPKLAGGGVLLHNCYQIVDQMMCNFPMPQQVHALNMSQASDKQQRLYLAEDAALVTMKFSDTLIGHVTALRRRGLGPREEFLRIYGKDRVVTVSGTQTSISHGRDQTSKKHRHENDPLRNMTRLLENFALSILSPDNNAPCSTGRENLKNMAVIEAAYLSARTGFPEEPARILQMAPAPAGTQKGA
jgi:predicted dehydrogenase